MIVFLVIVGFGVLSAYVEGRITGTIRRGEIWGVTKLLLGRGEPPAEVCCRACGVKLPDPMFRIELGYGAVVCEGCEDVIKLEAGLSYPEWFDDPMPEEQPPLPTWLPPDPPAPQLPEGAVEVRPGVYVMSEVRSIFQVDPPAPKEIEREDFDDMLSRIMFSPISVLKCKWCVKAVRDLPGLELCDQCIVNGPPPGLYRMTDSEAAKFFK